MKTVYFVRHGESTANIQASPVYVIDAPLTEKGLEQSRFIAERAKRIPFDVILASPLKRAKDTGAIIAERTGKPLEVHDFLVERRSPSSFEGMPWSDPESKRRDNEWIRTFFEPGLRLEDGENFDELKTRALSTLEYLTKRTEQDLLVVTHGMFLRMLAACVLVGRTVAPHEYKNIVLGTRTQNTGITVLRYDPEEKASDDRLPHAGWVMHVWNDHAHLG